MKQKTNMTFIPKTKIKKSTTIIHNTKKLEKNIPQKKRKNRKK